jgi:MFS transporter, putative metabolite:H+ symporter
MRAPASIKNPFNIIVIVAALGYFVDIYDLVLFGIVKDPSLRDLGVANSDLFRVGSHLLSMQMLGMLVGGIVWGMLGDKKGRLSTLFMTILIYSLANIANGFVHNLPLYSWLRFIAGFGLAGELGVGVTLVAEVMSKDARGLGTSLVSGFGVLGAVLAFTVAVKFNWRVAYFTGGGLGLVLLFLRVAVYESGMFENTKARVVSRGNYFILFTNAKRFKNYIFLILAGIPVWYVIAILVINASTFASEALHITGPVKGSTSVMIHYIGASMGSFTLGFLSRKWKSRRKALFVAVLATAILTTAYFFMKGVSPFVFYVIIFLLGLPMGGLWNIIVTTASEMFGTNIRATVTTTTPNFIRGSTVLIIFCLDYLKPTLGLWSAGLLVGTIFIVLSFISILFMSETYNRNLDYTEG